ncbi:MAG: hypothetical protein LBK01_00135 [Burkholderiaceae bacterium]|jgi:hypothetical protein|nr:hypothetical protein [Burkholderiaceae bacterium]
MHSSARARFATAGVPFVSDGGMVMVYLLVLFFALLFLGMLGSVVYFMLMDKSRRASAGHRHINHPDRDLPLYNTGECDRYSVGTFYWY